MAENLVLHMPQPSTPPGPVRQQDNPISQNNDIQGLRSPMTSPEAYSLPDQPNAGDVLEGLGWIPQTFEHLTFQSEAFILIRCLYRALADTDVINSYANVECTADNLTETLRRRFVRLTLGAMLGGQGRIPRKEQVDTVHDLVFGELDILFVAKTSFGKSLIIQAFSLITDLITIQVTPLVKLAEEQRASVLAVPCSAPVLISAETKKLDPGMFERIAAGQHSHIILGPEQLSSDQFQTAILNPVFERRCGLVAIDEAHLLSEWKDFRPEYANIRNLRFILPAHVHWFACTATASGVTEKKIAKYGGFSEAGDSTGYGYKTEVRRFSVDRPAIDIAVFPISKGQRSNWAYLDFLLANAPDVTASIDIAWGRGRAAAAVEDLPRPAACRRTLPEVLPQPGGERLVRGRAVDRRQDCRYRQRQRLARLGESFDREAARRAERLEAVPHEILRNAATEGEATL
ncbi:hypothetical protein DL767_010052 [Monosporascus sp. MG133]|nr:hypothetical protein DL767_010052 [Monosporascus sp. MG133]